MRVRCYRRHPRILCGVRGGGGGGGGDSLVDETVETDVRSGRAAIFAHHIEVLV